MYQVGVGVFGWSKEKVSKPVGNYTVDLLGHTPIERTQPSFHMANAYAELRTNQRSSDGRVDITIHQHTIWQSLQHNRLEPTHDLSRLLGMAAGTDAEI